MSMSCTHIGSTNADIAGLGVILAFAIQGGISLVLSGWSSFLRDVEAGGPLSTWANAQLRVLGVGKTSKEIYIAKRETIDKILATAADAQVLTGIALLLSSLIQRDSLDLYHYHIVYDTVNFTCVSFCGAILCRFNSKEEQRISRFIAIGIFSILYLAFAIIFGVHLGGWSLTSPGFCYNTRLTATSSAKHPYVDLIYLGITCFFSFAVLNTSIGVDEAINRRARKKLRLQPQYNQAGLPNGVQDILAATTVFKNRLFEIQQGIPEYVEDLLAQTMGAANARLYSELILGSFMSQTERTDAEAAALSLAGTSRQVLTLALAQYPLHLYSVFALRVSNEHLLTGESENAWGFGQIVALVMLAQTFIECFRGIKEYREKKRIILAAESLKSIANQLKVPMETEAPSHTSHPPVEVPRGGG